MLFNSYLFIFIFLPIVLAGFGLLAKRDDRRACLLWLVVGSLFYYGWWNPDYLILLGISVTFNFAIGNTIGRLSGSRRQKLYLIFGIVLNLALLGYFKYAGFLTKNVEALVGADWDLPVVILPLAISFFTFQQIAYLVDAYRGEAKDYSFLEYVLFVTFFPQLIAGPIVHHKEMMPQFERPNLNIRSEDIAVGGTTFILGLAKKVIIADTMAAYASPIFAMSESGTTPGLVVAWAGVLAYSMQIYFDFSGYSDMAIGIARLFGIRLPLNFASPYKAESLVEFWRRWHMTLSRFLRDYLYFPLGGNRRGPVRRHINLMLTMLLGGLWHGAGWNFVVWGGLHGFYLVVNHVWLRFRPENLVGGVFYRIACRGLTFLAVLLAWVFFRAIDFDSARSMLRGLVSMGASGGSLGFAFEAAEAYPKILIALLIAFLAPNTQELMGQTSIDAADGHPSHWWQWRPSFAWAILSMVFLSWSVLKISSYSEFIYFQF
ncbi:MAG: alginate O-acetyltransferase complex protein AlgI [Planctomycetota bacterium]|jgi:alginate O-acetyltransferase complex protein AlgI